MTPSHSALRTGRRGSSLLRRQQRAASRSNSVSWRSNRPRTRQLICWGETMVQDHGGRTRLTVRSRRQCQLPQELSGDAQQKIEEMQQLSGADDKSSVDEMVEDHEKDIKLFEQQAEVRRGPGSCAFCRDSSQRSASREYAKHSMAGTRQREEMAWSRSAPPDWAEQTLRGDADVLLRARRKVRAATGGAAVLRVPPAGASALPACATGSPTLTALKSRRPGHDLLPARRSHGRCPEKRRRSRTVTSGGEVYLEPLRGLQARGRLSASVRGHQPS